MNTEIIEEIFEVTTPASLEVRNLRGSVDIQAGAEDQITIRATKHLNTGDGAKTVVEIRQDAHGKVTAATKSPDRWAGFFGWWGLSPCEVDYEVRVPAGCSVNMKLVSSSGVIQGILGDTQIETVSGDLKLASLQGSLRVKSVSGGLVAKQIHGTTNFETVSGDVSLAESDLARLQGASVSGDFYFETPLTAGRYQVKTVSGNLTLVVPDGTNATATLTSLSGDIKSQVGYSAESHAPGKQKIVLGSGEAHLSMDSMSGDMKIKSAANRASGVESPPPDVMKILEQIENGQMTVDQGLTELQTGG